MSAFPADIVCSGLGTSCPLRAALKPGFAGRRGSSRKGRMKYARALEPGLIGDVRLARRLGDARLARRLDKDKAPSRFTI